MDGLKRQCNRCKELLSLDSFHKKKKGKYGVNSICKKCKNKFNLKYYELDKESHKKKMIKWQKENPEKHSEIKKRCRDKNKEKIKEYNKKWNKENSKLKCHHARVRYLDKLNRTPSWADLDAIKEFYKNCPEGYHVDHIIPLKGKNVSGLHVLNNLQYLKAEENLRKSNKF